MAARMAIIAMATSSSISVNPRRCMASASSATRSPGTSERPPQRAVSLDIGGFDDGFARADVQFLGPLPDLRGDRVRQLDAVCQPVDAAAVLEVAGDQHLTEAGRGRGCLDAVQKRARAPLVLLERRAGAHV